MTAFRWRRARHELGRCEGQTAALDATPRIVRCPLPATHTAAVNGLPWPAYLCHGCAVTMWAAGRVTESREGAWDVRCTDGR